MNWARIGITAVSTLIPAAGLVGQLPAAPRMIEAAFELPDGGEMRYGISVPAGYENARDTPRPLVLALHPGGRFPFYGRDFMRSTIEPALRTWEAIIVAPDVPGRRWAEPVSERAVIALLEEVLSTYVIDRGRILVTGFSMGGSGTWYLATRHPELFTGAIPMAASRGNDSLEGLNGMPVHLIHSPDDEVVEYGQAEETAELLAERGQPVRLIRVPNVGHYQMGAYVGPLRAAGEWMRDQWQTRGTQDGLGSP